MESRKSVNRLMNCAQHEEVALTDHIWSDKSQILLRHRMASCTGIQLQQRKQSCEDELLEVYLATGRVCEHNSRSGGSDHHAKDGNVHIRFCEVDDIIATGFHNISVLRIHEL